MSDKAARHGQIPRFVVNGLIATSVHFGVLSFNMEVLGLQSAGIANLIAATFGILASFIGSRYYVFRASKAALTGQAFRFLILYALLALANGLFMHLWADLLGWDYRIGFVFATAMQMVLSYLGNQRLVFTR